MLVEIHRVLRWGGLADPDDAKHRLCPQCRGGSWREQSIHLRPVQSPQSG
jgi:hypothetical protein